MAGLACKGACALASSLPSMLSSCIEILYDLRTKYQKNNKECSAFFEDLEGVKSNLEALFFDVEESEELQKDKNLQRQIVQLKQTLEDAVKLYESIMTVTGLNRKSVKNFAFSSSNSEKLERVQRAIDRAVRNVDLAINRNTRALVATRLYLSLQNFESPTAFSIGQPPGNVQLVRANLRGNQAIINWRQAENTTQYIIHVKQESSRNTITLEVAAPATSTAVELDGWNSYLIRVRAKNEHGSGPWSTPSCVVYMDQSPPSMPSKPQWNVAANRSITITVSEPDKIFEEQQVTHCLFRRRVARSCNWSRPREIEIETTTINAHTYINLDPEQEYHFSIQYRNRWGESEERMLSSHPIKIANVVPSPPLNFDFPRDQRKENQIGLKWEAPLHHPGAVDHYVLEMKQRREAQYTSKMLRVRTWFRACNLKTDTCYMFRVRAVNHNGDESAPSKVITVETKNSYLFRSVVVSALGGVLIPFGIYLIVNPDALVAVLNYDKYADD